MFIEGVSMGREIERDRERGGERERERERRTELRDTSPDRQWSLLNVCD